MEDKRGGREWRRCGSEGRRRGREVEEEEDDRIDDLAVESRDLDSDPQRPAIFFSFTEVKSSSSLTWKLEFPILKPAELRWGLRLFSLKP